MNYTLVIPACLTYAADSGWETNEKSFLASSAHTIINTKLHDAMMAMLINTNLATTTFNSHILDRK